jgi:hypothetical protein
MPNVKRNEPIPWPAVVPYPIPIESHPIEIAITESTIFTRLVTSDYFSIWRPEVGESFFYSLNLLLKAKALEFLFVPLPSPDQITDNFFVGVIIVDANQAQRRLFDQVHIYFITVIIKDAINFCFVHFVNVSSFFFHVIF